MLYYHSLKLQSSFISIVTQFTLVCLAYTKERMKKVVQKKITSKTSQITIALLSKSYQFSALKHLKFFIPHINIEKMYREFKIIKLKIILILFD